MKVSSYIIILATLLATLTIGVDVMRHPSDMFVFCLSASPYILLVILVRVATSKVAKIGSLVLSMITCAFGLYGFIYTSYFYHDVMLSVVYGLYTLIHWAGLVILSIPVLLLNKVK